MTQDHDLSVAIIGMSGRFAGADDVPALWSALAAGERLTRTLTREELIAAGVTEADADDPRYRAVRGRMNGADEFDHAFFGITPRDAELIDPQQRLFLEHSWSALEDAGHAPLQAGDVGVFAGAGTTTYLRMLLRHARHTGLDLERTLLANDRDYLATRVSYRLRLTGPSLTVLTACSSSLAAVHLACQSLLAGECTMALAGGVSVLFPQGGYRWEPDGIMSASGVCRPFDARADGTVGGDGVGVVVLKMLDAAMDDGDNVHAVIRGSAMNNDGSAKLGYTAPSAGGQQAVIRAALAAADVSARDLTFVETHGTGTPVGDPIEWQALSAVLRSGGAAPRSCAVGATKANVGHLDVASGVTGLIKAALCLRHRHLPAMPDFGDPNPHVRHEGDPLWIPTTGFDLPATRPNVAGVSSFGIGGTNVHMVLAEPPSVVPRAVSRDAELIVLSGRTRQSVAESARRLADAATARQAPLADVAATLLTGRTPMRYRAAVVMRTSGDLPRMASGLEIEDAPDTAPEVVFLFPGQGTQFAGMGDLGRFEAHRAAVDSCVAGLPPEPARQVRAALTDRNFSPAALSETALTQPALFVAEYALASLLVSFGIAPTAMLGLSLGELTAACLSGVMTPAEGARLAAARGALVARCPPGTLLAVELTVTEARRMVVAHGLHLEIVAENAPNLTVLAGTADDVDQLRRILGARVWHSRMRTSHAFHSTSVASAADALPGHIGTLAAPAVPYVSCVTGEFISAGEATDPDYYGRHLRSPTRFGKALATLYQSHPDAVMVEVGPGSTLSALALRQNIKVHSLTPVDAEPETALLAGLGALWRRGVPVDLAALSAPRARRVSLPSYPFARTRSWAAELDRPVPADEPDATTPPTGRPADRTTGGEPEAEIREIVAALWTRILGHSSLSADSEFMALGGDSLALIRLAALLRETFEVTVPLADLMAASTLGAQVRLIETLLLSELMTVTP